MRKTTIFVSLFLFLLSNYIHIHFYYSIPGNGEFCINFQDPIQYQKDYKHLSHRLRISSYIELQGQIIIDGNSDWALIASLNDWCNGNGTKMDPYIIENIAINGISIDECIIIKNTDVNFILRNCLIYNDGTGEADTGIKLISVKNGKIINNTIINNIHRGIYLESSEDNLIGYNQLNISTDSIYLSSSNYNNISYNHIDRGIEMIMIKSNNNKISNNILKQELSLMNCDNNIITYNNITQKNYYGLRISGINNTISNNNFYGCGLYIVKSGNPKSHTITNSNLVNGKPLYYFINENNLNSNNFSNAGQIILIDCYDTVISNLMIDNTTIGFDFYHCVNITIINNTINNNHHGGIEFTGCYRNLIIENRIISNSFGIYFYDSNHNDIIGNLIINNGYSSTLIQRNSGIIFIDSLFNHVTRNVFENNRYGLKIDEKSRDNLLYNNSFIDNTAYDPLERNQWDNGALGNFWSYYTGEDLNDDGIGDTPYDVPPSGNSMDYFPIWDDGDDKGPKIIINTPQMYQIFADNAPNYSISIQDQSPIDAKWYTLNDNPKKYYFILNSSSLNQLAWDDIKSGIISLRFWANDTQGNLGFREITVIKHIGIQINKPSKDKSFNNTSPKYNIIIYSQFNISLTWYSLDNGITNHTFTGQIGFINQDAWNLKEDGLIVIKFCANDSMGHTTSSNVSVYKDTITPELKVYSPYNNQLFGLSPPFFNINIYDLNLHSKYYSLNNRKNITFTTENQINPTEWSICRNGTVIIRFYAKDLAGNTNSCRIFTRKDALEPVVIIHLPTQNQVFGNASPPYSISIIEEDIKASGYIIWTTYEKFYITDTKGRIDQNAWNKIGYGPHTLRFFVEDKAGNIGSADVIIKKSDKIPLVGQILSIPFYLISTLNIAILTIAAVIIFILKRKRIS